MKSFNKIINKSTLFSDQNGKSLIEIMIVMFISLFILLNVYTVFLSNKKTYQFQQGLSRIQENARIAIYFLNHDVRMAGYYGCTSALHENSLMPWFVKGVSEYSDAIQMEYVDEVVDDIDIVLSDQVVLNQKSDWKVGDEVVISSCDQMEILKIKAIKNKRSKQIINVEPSIAKHELYLPPSTQIGKLERIVYYIANTGRENGAGKPIHSLYRAYLSSGISSELIENVDRMNIFYGVFSEKNKSIKYIKSEDLKNERQIKAIKINLLFTAENNGQHHWETVIKLRNPKVDWR